MARIPDSMLVRILADLMAMPTRPGEDEFRVVERWLARSSCGTQLRRYLADEAELLALAAARLTSGDEDDRREVSWELGNISARLARLSE